MRSHIVMVFSLIALSMEIAAVQVIETTKQFNALIASGVPAVILFYEGQQAQAEKLINNFDSVSQTKQGLNFARVNIILNSLRKITDTYNVKTFPTILLFDGRNPIKQDGEVVMLSGYVATQAIQNFIDQHFVQEEDSEIYDDNEPEVIYRDRPVYVGTGYPYYGYGRWSGLGGIRWGGRWGGHGYHGGGWRRGGHRGGRRGGHGYRGRGRHR